MALFETLITKTMIYPRDFDTEIFIEDQENKGLDMISIDFNFTK